MGDHKEVERPRDWAGLVIVGPYAPQCPLELELSDERDEELELVPAASEDLPPEKCWATVLQLQLTVLVYVRSLRQGSFQMYLDALTELATWFHAMDHTNYARWIPVHLRDMVTLPTAHPEVCQGI